METHKSIKYNSKYLYINQFPLEYSAKHSSLKSINVTCKQIIIWRRELIYSKFLSFILMNHKLRFHQEIARGKRFDENSVNTPGGIVVETKRAYETLLFFSLLKSLLGWAVHEFHVTQPHAITSGPPQKYF